MKTALVVAFLMLASAIAGYKLGVRADHDQWQPRLDATQKKLADCQATYSQSLYLRAVEVNLAYHRWFAKRGLDPQVEGIYEPPAIPAPEKKLQ